MILSTFLAKEVPVPISAVDSITLAIEHTKGQLFRPLRIGQWTRLAFVGLLAGELGSNGCNRSNFQAPVHHPPMVAPHFPGFSVILPPALIAAAIAAIIASIAVGLILMYVSSVMRFILFDSVVARECHIRWDWNRRLAPGWRLFVFKLLYGILSLAGIGLIIGIPVAFAFSAGWFHEPKEHLAPLVFAGAFLFCAFFVFIIATAVIFVLTKDFVVPQMALEDLSVMEGWRRLWAMMKLEKGAYVAYVVMKIVLAIVAGILMGVATLFLGLIIAVPSIGLGILAVITGKTAVLTWNAHTIALAIGIGSVLLVVFLYLVALIYVPAIVFFSAYSIHFFAARYPRLQAALYTPRPGPPGAAPAAV
jgi:hypothetical protein